MNMNDILRGTTVLEYCELVAGPYCAKVMADCGAEVIKIEKPGSGDESRSRGTFHGDIPHPERSCLFFYLNTNKLGVTLNLDKPIGREIFRKLAKNADIIIEDKPPDTMRAMDLDYGSLKNLNPRLIVTSITPFGATGPNKHYKAYHLNTYHAGGDGYLLQSGSSYLNREPIKAGGFTGEYEAGLSTAVATLAALYTQRKTGLGQHIDVSKQEALMALNRYNLTSYPNEGFAETRATRRYDYGGIVACNNGYIVVQVTQDHHWQRLVELMGSPEWAKDEKLKDRESRKQHGEEINVRLLQWMQLHTKEELFRLAKSAGVPLGKFDTAADVANSEQLRDRGFFVTTEHPEMGKVTCPSAPHLSSEAHCKTLRPAPHLGQHNYDIYCARLGYSKDELVKMRHENII